MRYPTLLARACLLLVRPLTGVIVATSVLVACAAFAAVDEGFAPTEPSGLPDARELLQNVIASLPNVAVSIDARILSKTPRGKVDKKLNADMILDWYGDPPYVRYTIRDAFGGLLDELVIAWPGTEKQQIRYVDSASEDQTPLEDLYARIQDTDISWIDLTLSYLWWPGGKTVGSEPIKGRFCYIVDLSSPDEAGEYAGVRLWIDAQINILLQAAAYDDAGQLIKLLEVKSFKKVRDVWIIKDLDIQSFPVRHKTVLRVRGAEPLNPEDREEVEPEPSDD